LPEALVPYVPQFHYALHDISVRTNAAIKGEVLTRLVQLAMRHIYSKEPVEPLRELLALIRQWASRPTSGAATCGGASTEQASRRCTCRWMR
jgi:hypothetical protein